MNTTTIPAIYASTSGNTEIVVETIAEVWHGAGISLELHRSEQASVELLNQNNLFLLATSTWEHGKLNPFFRVFFEALKTQNCSGKKAIFVGLGDTRYEPVLFCGGLDLLRERWLAQGGQELGRSLLIDGDPYPQLATTVMAWANDTLALLGQTNS